MIIELWICIGSIACGSAYEMLTGKHISTIFAKKVVV